MLGPRLLWIWMCRSNSCNVALGVPLNCSLFKCACCCMAVLWPYVYIPILLTHKPDPGLMLPLTFVKELCSCVEPQAAVCVCRGVGWPDTYLYTSLCVQKKGLQCPLEAGAVFASWMWSVHAGGSTLKSINARCCNQIGAGMQRDCSDMHGAEVPFA